MLNLALMHGHAHKFHRTIEWIRDILVHKAYLDGTFYYPAPENILFALDRLQKNYNIQVEKHKAAIAASERTLHQVYEPVYEASIFNRTNGFQPSADNDTKGASTRTLDGDVPDLNLVQDCDRKTVESLANGSQSASRTRTDSVLGVESNGFSKKKVNGNSYGGLNSHKDQKAVNQGVVDKELKTLAFIHQSFASIYKQRCVERISQPGDAQSLAMKIICCLNIGVDPLTLAQDIEALRSLQCEDGSWPWCPLYQAPVVKFKLGNQGVVTALAVKALKMVPAWWNWEDTVNSQNGASLAAALPEKWSAENTAFKTVPSAILPMHAT
jgi:hypothetical protein